LHMRGGGWVNGALPTTNYHPAPGSIVMAKTYFTTVDGKEFKITAVSFDLISRAIYQKRQEYIERGEPMDVPTYEVELAGGVKETYTHDEKSIEQRANPEEAAAWAAHKDAAKRFQAEQASLTTRILIWEGLVPNIQDAMADPTWVTRHERWGVKVPTEPDARTEYYVSLEVLKTAEDTLRFVQAITALSGQGRIDEGEVDRLMDLFRHKLSSGSKRQAAPGEGTAPTAGPLAALDPAE